ncbi:MAG TPA: GrpB family protein [Chlamydiales bacterium]|nr:GrpB family protein [Chlamydiales bacterium]
MVSSTQQSPFVNRDTVVPADCVQIVPYDPQWPQLYEEESPQIQQALNGNCLSIHHIGSTSVPGLNAKPKIDILAVVKSFASVDPTSLERLGFKTRGEMIPTGRYFKKESPSIHLHLFEEGNPLIAQDLKFRDWLREHPEDRDAYGAFKQKLAFQFPEHNGMAFCRAKTEFIKSILAKMTHKGQIPTP